MTDQIYKQLMERFVEQGGRCPGIDIPEFYPMAEALFTPEEAAIVLVEKPGYPEPPPDHAALEEALRAAKPAS